MPWKVRFRDQDLIGNEGWDPEFEFEVREALTATQELSGSAEIVEGEGQLIALYSAKDFGPPYNDVRFTGDGS